jgi:hypothetical protein
MHAGNESGASSVNYAHRYGSISTLLHSTHFWYAGGKFKHIYTELFFRKVAYAMCDVPWYVEQMDFTDHSCAS